MIRYFFIAALLYFNSSVTAASEWLLDEDNSAINFSIPQYGVEVEGQFEQFTTNFFFDSETPETGKFELTVDMASVNTWLDMVDVTLHNPDWLDINQYPQATFKSTKLEVTDTGKGYSLSGDFQLKSITRSITFPLEWQQQDDQAIARAKLSINRLDYAVGIGDDAVEDQVGEVVEVSVEFTLNRLDGPTINSLPERAPLSP